MRALRLGFATAALRGRRWLAGAAIVNLRGDGWQVWRTQEVLADGHAAGRPYV